jgi:hypothetical protein
MMISEDYNQDVFIADFTNFVGKPGYDNLPCQGVLVGNQENGIIPSFVIRDEHAFPFRVVNNEHNLSVYKRSDGSMVSQCECIIYSDRNDNRRGWMFFLELKYCEAKNLYSNMLDGIGQLKATCNYIYKEKQEFDSTLFKKYLVISTPGVEPLDPFDASYFNQDEMLTLKEDTGAVLRATNEVFIQTPAVLKFSIKLNNA